MSKKSNPHIGSSLDDLLREEGTLEVATAKAIKSTLAWQLREAMKEQHISKVGLAKRMKTSRAQLDRLLDPDNASVTLRTLTSAAESLGKTVKINLVDV